jgi:coatomer subunit beta
VDETQADTASRLSRIVQLTGNSDTVYAEAFVNVHQYDILLGAGQCVRACVTARRLTVRGSMRAADVLVVNQTNDTLQNLALELATLGDLKLVERPAAHTLGPRDFLSIRAHVKVSSTDTGVIFGNLVYDTTKDAEAIVVVLNDIHIDIMDYIQAATCTETEVRTHAHARTGEEGGKCAHVGARHTQFRQMWAEFEWENKVLVNTNITCVAHPSRAALPAGRVRAHCAGGGAPGTCRRT